MLPRYLVLERTFGGSEIVGPTSDVCKGMWTGILHHGGLTHHTIPISSTHGAPSCDIPVYPEGLGGKSLSSPGRLLCSLFNGLHEK